MIGVIVNDRIGKTTSIIPHRNGKYPVWFNDSRKVEFFEKEKVEFINK